MTVSSWIATFWWSTSCICVVIPTINTMFFDLSNFYLLSHIPHSYQEHGVSLCEVFGNLFLSQWLYPCKTILHYISGEVGGFMGLFLGASVLTLCEIMDLIVRLGLSKCHHIWEEVFHNGVEVWKYGTLIGSAVTDYWIYTYLAYAITIVRYLFIWWNIIKWYTCKSSIETYSTDTSE